MKFVKSVLLGLVCVQILSACSALLGKKKEEEPQFDNVTVVEETVIDSRSVPIFPKKAALTTDTARRFSIELPMRCEVDWNNQSVVSVVPAEKIEINLIKLSKREIFFSPSTETR